MEQRKGHRISPRTHAVREVEERRKRKGDPTPACRGRAKGESHPPVQANADRAQRSTPHQPGVATIFRAAESEDASPLKFPWLFPVIFEESSVAEFSVCTLT